MKKPIIAHCEGCPCRGGEFNCLTKHKAGNYMSNRYGKYKRKEILYHCAPSPEPLIK